eukprot:g1941.t1
MATRQTAAAKVQRVYRGAAGRRRSASGRKARKELEQAKLAAAAHLKQEQQRQRLRREARTKAATRIQGGVRRRQARLDLQLRLDQRRRAARERAIHAVRAKAASRRIQGAWAATKVSRRRRWASSTIHRCYRGFVARARVDTARKARIQSLRRKLEHLEWQISRLRTEGDILAARAKVDVNRVGGVEILASHEFESVHRAVERSSTGMEDASRSRQLQSQLAQAKSSHAAALERLAAVRLGREGVIRLGKGLTEAQLWDRVAELKHEWLVVKIELRKHVEKASEEAE